MTTTEPQKYARSLHAPISLGTTSDDRFMPRDFLSYFASLPKLVLTEKLDGQNNCFAAHGLYARSHTAPTQHSWDKPLLQRWQQIKDDLGDLELFGENMYGIHSIAYSQLESYFYLFAVRRGGHWLSWEEVKFYAQLFDFPTVPEIPIMLPLADFTQKYANEDIALAQWLAANLGSRGRRAYKLPANLAATIRIQEQHAAKVLLSVTPLILPPTTATYLFNPMNSTTFSNWYEPNTLKPMFIGRKLGSLPVLSTTINTIGKAGSFRRPEVQLSNNKKDNYVDIPILHTRPTS